MDSNRDILSEINKIMTDTNIHFKNDSRRPFNKHKNQKISSITTVEDFKEFFHAIKNSKGT